MENRNFRPTVDGLEDRSIPSVTPTQVVAAYVGTQTATDELQDLTRTLAQGRTTREIQFLATHLRQVSEASKADAGILADHLHSLQIQIAANPALAGQLSQYTGGIGFAEYQATVNAAYAEVYARGFGAPPIVPPPPPVGVDNGPNFGTGLPFSLTDPNWQSLPDGLRTWTVTPGSGTAVKTGDQITADYTGFLTNGTVFDSSAKSGKLSTTLDSSHLIPGFAEGMVGMKPGETRRIDIPANLAYGANPPQGSIIPPNSELVFEVTLISSP